jgi:hypothetical protein
VKGIKVSKPSKSTQNLQTTRFEKTNEKLAFEQRNDASGYQSKPGTIRLERRLVWQIVPRITLLLQSCHEPAGGKCHTPTHSEEVKTLDLHMSPDYAHPSDSTEG